MSMCDMIFGWMVFCVVVSEVSTTFIPVETELALSFSAFKPVEAHVDCSHAFDDDCVVDRSISGGVINLDW